MENSSRFFKNMACAYYPCHQGIEEINCLFCYCPLYTREQCPGTPLFKEKDGKKIKVCTSCIFPHVPEHYEQLVRLLKEQRK